MTIKQVTSICKELNRNIHLHLTKETQNGGVTVTF